eukprot:c27278_g1_i1.p1 GENE.c27278_g1_i1~~c27278_g1_i1.p1  ORF type:complete len:200 (-),score=32.95 c27278_g1_i1:383-982(-)
MNRFTQFRFSQQRMNKFAQFINVQTRTVATVAESEQAHSDPGWFRFAKGGFRYVFLPLFAWRMYANMSDMVSFGMMYDPKNAEESTAKIIVNEIDGSGNGPFWFEYKVNGETKTSHRLTPSTLIYKTIAPILSAKYPAGSVVPCKYNREYPKFAYLEEGYDNEDFKNYALLIGVFDAAVILLSYKLFRRSARWSLSKLK